MPNPSGRNGHGAKVYPPDEELTEALLHCVRSGFTQRDKIRYLVSKFSLSIGTTTLNVLEKRLGIPSLQRTPASTEVARQAIVDEIEKDVTKANGPRFVKEKLRNKGVLIPRDRVRAVMLEECPEGFDARYPGRRKAKIPRVALTSIGPFHEVCGDGHEKLGAQALKLGNDVGISIYTYKDKFSDVVLKASVVRHCRSPAAIGHLYLDFIEEYGAIPIQTTFDKGSEVGIQYAIQVALRNIFAPGIDPDVYPECVLMKSVHNTVIEGFWRWLREKAGGSMKVHLLRGKDEHIFNPSLPFHTDLFYWIFPPLVQAGVDEFCDYWNHHHVRLQADKILPSGHVPLDALENPSLYGGKDCRIRVSQEVIIDLREDLSADVGSREECLRWVSPEFAEMATTAWSSIGSPTITFENGWKVFAAMSDVLETLV